MNSRRLRHSLLALPALAAALTLVACSAGGGSESAGSMDAPAAGPAEAGGDAAALDKGNAFSTASGGRADGAAVDSVDPATDYAQSYVISTGSVGYRSKDVATTRFDVQAVIDAHGGRTDEEKSESDDEGGLLRSRIVFRVPVKEFGDAMAELDKLEGKTSSSTSSEDVTTQVIDTDVRVKSQERSIERIQILFSRAQNIRDIMAIETQLRQREADLDSLKQQQAWLKGQTSWSTITVNLQRLPAKKVVKDDKDSGFLAGLTTGWHGLKKVTLGLATFVGAALPFAVVLLILGIPAWLFVRRSRRGTTPAEPAPAES
ncbi:MAG: DUF4349 domain-containing protein [Nocardioidaceae bacterium]|nr:DUF4349 domain-containing protein [Nocardioidaceae bacterium]